MTELTNSTRTLHKATYVPIQASERDSRELRNNGRAFLKLNLLRTLAPSMAELKRLRSTRGGGVRRAADATRTRTLTAMLRAHDAELTNPLEAARHLANVDVNSFIEIAEAIVADRKRIGAQVAETLTRIRQRIDVHPTTRPAAELSVQELIAWAAINDRRMLQPIESTALSIDSSEANSTFSAHGKAVTLYDVASTKPVEAALTSFVQSMQVEPVGRLYLERLEMYPAGVERGELVGTVPLAPLETVTISHKEWSTSSQEYENIVQDFFEGYSEKGVAEKNDASMASDSESRHSNSFTFGASLSGGYAGITVSTSVGLSETSDQREALRRSVNSSREITQKASARTRKEHKVTFKLEEKKGASDESFRTITNPSPTNPMRVDYFRLMRKWRTDLYRYGLRMTYDIVIPNPGAALWARYEELAELERQLSLPHVFSTKLADVTETSWPQLAAQYNARVDPPPAAVVKLTQSRELREPNGGMTSIEFIAPPGYALGADVAVRGSFVILDGTANLGIALSGEGTVAAVTEGSIGGAGTFKSDRTGALIGGERSALFVSYGENQIIGINVSAGAYPLPGTIEAWRARAFQALQEGALQAYVAQVDRLRDRRQQLMDEIARFDSLTLRRMEREEIVRGTLQWLFGPQFKVAPAAIATIIDSLLADANSPVVSAGELAKLSAAEWSDVLSFGEFVKFLHQAVEWENVLYLLYPYFWGSPALAKRKRFFQHQDALHRDFLRAGFARVVLTIRPGFERAFTELLETGAFNTLSSKHPYMTIASEIEAFARTNFPGIPPANSEKNARPLLYPQQRSTWTDIQRVMTLLENFKVSNGKYPEKLSQLPGAPFKDAWGNEYTYRMPGDSGEYDLVSLGKDGADGGDDLNADISATADASLVARWYDYTPTSGIDIQLNSGFATMA